MEQDYLQQIRDKLGITDLVSRYVELKKQGRNFKGVCPFHSEKTPSFVVSPEKGLAYCFGCNQGGDIFTFMQLIEGVEFVESVNRLAEITGVQLPEKKMMTSQSVASKTLKERVSWLNQHARDLFEETLWDKKNEDILNYVRKRGLDDELINKFKLGFASKVPTALVNSLPERVLTHTNVLEDSGLFSFKKDGGQMMDRFRNRLIIPIHSDKGAVVAFGGRVLDPNDQPKYLNSPDTVLYNKSRILFGFHLAKDAIRKEKAVIVVEGYFDVMAFHAVGIFNVVATCGTALTDGQVNLLRRFADTICFAFDNDKAGRAALLRGAEISLKYDLNLRVLDFAEKDAGDMLISDAEELKSLGTNLGIPFLDWIIADESKKAPNLSDRVKPEYLKMFTSSYMGLVLEINSSIIKDAYVRKFSQFIGVDAKMFYDELHDLQKSKQKFKRADKVNTVQEKEKNFVFSLKSEELLLGYFFLDTTLFEDFKESFEKLGSLLQLNQVYKAIMGFYNSDRDYTDLRLEELSIDADCRARLQKVVLYLETKESDVSTRRHLKEEVKLIINKLLRERKSSYLDRLKAQISDAEANNDREKTQELLKEYTLYLTS